MRRDFFIPAALLVLGAVMGFVAGLCLQNWKDSKDSKLRLIDYEIESSSILPPGPYIPGKEVSIRVDGKDAAHLVRLDISVYNFSDRDFEHVYFFIELIPENPEADLSGQILAESACGASNIPDSVIRLKDIAPADRPGAVRYGYDVRSLNHTTRFAPSFRATYFLMDSAQVKLDIKTDRAGIELRRLQRKNVPLQGGWWPQARQYLPSFLAGGSSVAVLLIIFLWRYSKRTYPESVRTPTSCNASKGD